LAGRCPRCGQGRLFRGFLAVADRCDRCQLGLSAHDAADGPVAFVILLAGCIVVPSALVVEVTYGWPIWLHLLVWLPLAAVLAIALTRPLKALLIGLQFKHRAHDFDHG
jgi:uncharacterized protein (DUF983 family)